jgi:alkylmercury lyase
MTEAELNRLADALQGTFPARTDAPLALTLLRALAHGAPVSVDDLARRAGRPAADIDRRLSRWPNVERDRDGGVVAFAGLSLRPTTHALHVDDRALYTWCAWDTLFLPELLGATADVHSTCPATGRRVTLTVTPEAVLDVMPREAVVSIVMPQSTDAIRSSFCCDVMFFASPSAGHAWLSSLTDGALLTIEEAHALGRLTNERCFKAREDAPA